MQNIIEVCRNYNFINLPEAITKDNVNDILVNYLASLVPKDPDWVTAVVSYDKATVSMVEEVLALKPFIRITTLQYCRPEFLHLLFDYGADVNMVNERGHHFFDTFMITDPPSLSCFVCVDYGAKFSHLPPQLMTPSLKTYIEKSNKRVAVCRATLCALLWCSRRSFIPLRGIILELARSVWAQRGREGCGPRGKGWDMEI
jgi:hypothetical protein